jgi:hypothetical protein
MSDALWARLRDAGLVAGEAPVASASPSPWYVRTMLGVAAWIGALFLLGFVGAGLAFVLKSATAAIIVGLGCCAAAYPLFRTRGANDFIAQFALALSLAGQALFAFGVFDALRSDAAAYFILAAFEVVLVVALANFVHRVWSTFAAAIALSLGFGALGIHHAVIGAIAAAFAITWLNEFRWSAHAAIWRPVGFGLAVALLQPDAAFGWRRMILGAGTGPESAGPWIGRGIVALVFLYAAAQLLRREGVALGGRTGIAALAGAAILMAVALPAPGIGASLLVVVIAFAHGSRPLFGLGLLALGAYLSYYYYLLQATLLEKSAVLAVTGAVLLALRFAVLPRLWPAGEGRRA